MATKFLIGNGTVLSASSDGGTTLVPVKQMKSITFSGSKVDFDDITNLDSTGSYREYVPTLIDPGTCAFQGVFAAGEDPGQLLVSAAFEAKTLLHWVLQFPPGPGKTIGYKRVWDGYTAEKPNIDAGIDKSSTYSGSIRITGPIVDTAASA